MPQLGKDPTTAGMDSLGYWPPRLDLRVIIYAWRKGITSSLRRDIRSFGDNQACRSPLSIIFNHQGRRQTIHASAAPRKRCHDDAVCKVVGTKSHRLKEIARRSGHNAFVRHGISPSDVV